MNTTNEYEQRKQAYIRAFNDGWNECLKLLEEQGVIGDEKPKTTSGGTRSPKKEKAVVIHYSKNRKNKRWTDEEVAYAKKKHREGRKLRLIARDLRRTTQAVNTKLSAIGVSRR